MQSFDSESVVYGYIRDLNVREQDLRQLENFSAVSRLEAQHASSFLSREMFSLPEKVSSEFDEGLEPESYLIHFGSSYLGVEYEWKQWLAQFEGLLKKMYWVSAVVHLETEISGRHIFQWGVSSDEHKPGEHIQANQLEWVRESQ
ncbi:MAG: hypothetical protein ACI93R_000518 [Flavobacteriales bacterium]